MHFDVGKICGHLCASVSVNATLSDPPPLVCAPPFQ